jgi:hypothetical protein
MSRRLYSSLILVLVSCGILRAGDEVAARTFTLTIEDSEGHSRLLTFGVHPDATYAFDASLGEHFVPPIPPVPVFDARFVDLPGRRRFPGTGGEKDIRQFTSASQTDTFMVRFQPSEKALPLRFQWDPDVASRCERLLFEVLDNGVRHSIEATQQSSFVLHDEGIFLLRIILSGPHAREECR